MNLHATVNSWREEAVTKLNRLDITEVNNYIAKYIDLLDKNCVDINPSCPIKLDDGRHLLKRYERVVIGAMGPFIECFPEDFYSRLEIPKGEEWRVVRPAGLCRHVKHLVYSPARMPDVKVFRQVNTVTWADYKVGRYYVDFMLTIKKEGI